jgi:hypothetical protein
LNLLSKSDWLNGENGKLERVQLNPSTQKVYNSTLNGIVVSSTPVTVTPTSENKPITTIANTFQQKSDEQPEQPKPQDNNRTVAPSSTTNGTDHKPSTTTNGNAKEEKPATKPVTPPKVQLRPKETVAAPSPRISKAKSGKFISV